MIEIPQVHHLATWPGVQPLIPLLEGPMAGLGLDCCQEHCCLGYQQPYCLGYQVVGQDWEQQLGLHV